MTEPPTHWALQQLWWAMRGRATILRDRSLSIPRLAREPSGPVGARLACFLAGLGVMVAVSAAGALLLQDWPDAPSLLRSLCGAVGVWLGVIITVAVTRSELRAAVLGGIGCVFGAGAAIVTALPAVVLRFAPDRKVELGGYLAAGVALGMALGARAVISYRRFPNTRRLRPGTAVLRAAATAAMIAVATAAIYWLSQHTAPGAPDSNAVVTGLLAALVIGLLYYFVVPAPANTLAGAELKRQSWRVAPVCVAGPIGGWIVVRSTGAHGLPGWVDGMAIGCLVGLLAGYAVDLLERPFAGRRVATAAVTVVAVALLPALRQLAFDHTSAPGVVVAQIGALVGLVGGALAALAVVRRPDPPLLDPDPPDFARSSHVVLFLGASPDLMPALSVSQEAHAIEDGLRGGRHAGAFEFRSRYGTRFADLARDLAELKPTVVHLSGHGNAGTFYFHDADDLAHAVPIAAIVETLRAAPAPVKVVVVNACQSDPLADRLVATGDRAVPAAGGPAGAAAEPATAAAEFAVGMTADFVDTSACAFAGGFYRALSDGKSPAEAYRQGQIAIVAKGLPGANVPHAHCRDTGCGGEPLVPVE